MSDGSPSLAARPLVVEAAGASATPRVGLAFWPALALTVGSGIAYGLAFPPLAWRPLAWVALVPWLIAIRRGSLARAVVLGVVWAHVETFVTSDCLPGAVVNYYRQSALVGWMMLEGATVVTMVPYYGVFAVAYWLLARRPGAALPFLAAAAWVGAELARVVVLGGNPWAVSGYSQVGVLPLMQVADAAGVHGISYVVAVVNAALAELVLTRGAAPAARRAARQGAAAAAAIVVAALAYGTWRLAQPFGDPAREVPVVVVQGNLDLGAEWREAMYGRNLAEYLRLTVDAVERSGARLVFWPESALTFFLAGEASYRAAIGRVLSRLDVELIAGGPRVEETDPATEPAYYNATFLIAPAGAVVAWQDKTKLLPFAEYFPLQAVDLLRREFGRARQFTPGTVRPALPSRAGGAGAVVCNEAMFPEPAHARVAAGAEYLVNPANDSWFASPKYSLQAFDIVRLRAVEQRRFLVRPSTAGPSAIVDPHGRVVARSALQTQTILEGAIHPSGETTPYHRVGDLFAAGCLLVAVAAVARGWRARG